MNSSHQLPLHLQPTAVHLHTIPPGLQSLGGIPHEANETFFQQRYTHHLAGPSPHALQFQGHAGGLQQVGGQAAFPPFPGSEEFTRAYELSAPPPPQQQQQQHIQGPPTQARVQVQQPPLQRPPQPIRELEAQNEFLQNQPQAPGQVQVQDIDEAPVTNHGHFEGLRLIRDPPDLDAWRDKLFHVDGTITLTEEEFKTYFPHVDNVYSHRSTQRHKRKRFVSHYWDCRLKGRPSGTKKSTDPEKKKRKRVARERDLCDVKVKITEYFDGDEFTEQTGQQPPGGVNTFSLGSAANGNQFFGQNAGGAGTWGMPSMTMTQAATANAQSKKFYTIQRVNGNGGNGKGNGVAGPHKHTLEESDRVKKNSVQRWLSKNEMEKKKVQMTDTNQSGDPQKKTYHKKATGNALTTVKSHSKEDDLKLFGSCFCPFVQRVWISLEHKQIPYQYIEVDPYKKPQSLLEINPRGLVPAIRHGPTWSTYESTVIMEYLEDLKTGPALMPAHPQARATCRLWTDHINRNIVPTFYRLLQAQDPNDQVTHATELRTEISKLVDAADATGPFFFGQHFGFVDVQIAPWVVRLKKVLGPYRGWPEPEDGSRWKAWVEAIEAEESVRSTTSDDALYLDSYQRYAENRPGTSQVANAVNEGRGLP